MSVKPWAKTLFLLFIVTGVELIANSALTSATIIMLLYATFRTKDIMPFLVLTVFISGTPADYMFRYSFELIPNVPFISCFSLLLLVKYRNSMVYFKKYFVFKESKKFFLFHLMYLIILGVIYGIRLDSSTGLGLNNHIIIVRYFTLLPLLFLIPSISRAKYFWKEFEKNMLVILLVNLFFQLFYLQVGIHFNNLFTGSVDISGISAEDGRAANGWLYSLIYLPVLGLLRLVKKVSAFKYYTGIFIVLVSITSTGSRGYLLAALFFIAVFGFIQFLTAKYVLRKSIITYASALILLPIIYNLNFTQSRIKLYKDRFDSLVSESSSAVGGISRVDIRGELGEVVLNRANEAFFFGYGYSAEGIEFYDQHVGIHSTLLSGGLIGSLLYLLTVFVFVAELLRITNLNVLFLYKLLVLFFLLIVHLTSTDLFSPYFSFETYHYNKIVLHAFILALCSLSFIGK